VLRSRAAMDAQHRRQLLTRRRVGRSGQEGVDLRAVGAGRLESFELAEFDAVKEFVVRMRKTDEIARGANRRDFAGMIPLRFNQRDLALGSQDVILDFAL